VFLCDVLPTSAGALYADPKRGSNVMAHAWFESNLGTTISANTSNVKDALGRDGC
jgi:hypothetical protein